MANQITLQKGSLKKLQEKIKKLQNPMDQQTADRVADAVVQALKQVTANQRSPVRGFGRYERLSPSYAKFKKRKAGNTKANLRLSGSMIESLRGRGVPSGGAYKARIDFSSSRSKKLEGFHRETFPPRPLIPTGDEGFSKEINDIVLDILRKRVRNISR